MKIVTEMSIVNCNEGFALILVATVYGNKRGIWAAISGTKQLWGQTNTIINAAIFVIINLHCLIHLHSKHSLLQPSFIRN